jgi:hypothetical protein
MLRTSCGLDVTLALATAAPDRLRSPRDRLRSVTTPRLAATLAAAASSSRSSPGRISGCWRAPLPTEPLRIAVVPVVGICRVIVSARAGATRAPTNASAAHAKTGTSDQASTLLRIMASPFLARADAGASSP